MIKMIKKPLPSVELTLDRIIGGGQTIGKLDSGKKCLVWGGLPGERVIVQLTKKKHAAEAGGNATADQKTTQGAQMRKQEGGEASAFWPNDRGSDRMTRPPYSRQRFM